MRSRRICGTVYWLTALQPPLTFGRLDLELEVDNNLGPMKCADYAMQLGGSASACALSALTERDPLPAL